MVQAIDEKVTFKTLMRVHPERVYDALASSEGLDSWFTQGSEVDARKGGRIVFRWKNYGLDQYTGELEGPVLEAKRPERFVFQWKVDLGSYRTTVEMDFQQVQEGTILRLVEHGYRDDGNGLQNMLNRAGGWAEVLTLLKFYLEHGLRY
jgi:uncharacterized protein YndB with AHSA1/START domain